MPIPATEAQAAALEVQAFAIPPKLNTANLRQVAESPTTRAMATKFLAARLYSAAVTIKVDGYANAPLQLDQFAYFNDKGERITDRKYLFTSDVDAEVMAPFYEHLDGLHKAHGFDMKPGYCPALVAQEEVRKVELALVERCQEALGMPLIDAGSEIYDEALKLFIEMATRPIATRRRRR